MGQIHSSENDHDEFKLYFLDRTEVIDEGFYRVENYVCRSQFLLHYFFSS